MAFDFRTMPFAIRGIQRRSARSSAADNLCMVRDAGPRRRSERRWILAVFAIAYLATDPPRKAGIAGETKSDGRSSKEYCCTDDPSHGLSLRFPPSAGLNCRHEERVVSRTKAPTDEESIDCRPGRRRAWGSVVLPLLRSSGRSAFRTVGPVLEDRRPRMGRR